MTFDAREATRAAEAEYPPYEFIDLEGLTHRLPHPLMVDPGLARRAQAGEIDGADMIRELSPGAAEAIDNMAPAVQRALLADWRASMGAELEELGKELEPSSETPDSEPALKPTSPREGSTSGRTRSGSSAEQPKRS